MMLHPLPQWPLLSVHLGAPTNYSGETRHSLHPAAILRHCLTNRRIKQLQNHSIDSNCHYSLILPVMIPCLSPKPHSHEHTSNPDPSITQSRSSLFCQDPPQDPEQQTSVETRKFKIDIEDKFSQSEHNHKYFFPRDICFWEEELTDEEDLLMGVLAKGRFYDLGEQNAYRDELSQRLKKSRSELRMGLFRKAIQEKAEQRSVSKSKPRQTHTSIKAPIKFKRVIKDKQNNLNFQNLCEERESVEESVNIKSPVSKGKSKSKIQLSAVSTAKSKKIAIPRIHISDREEAPKCFRDLAKLEIYRR